MFQKRIRAWNKKDNTMYKVAVIDFEKDQVELTPFWDESKECCKSENVLASLDNVVLMQESGLQDDIGFNVFEGDLIEWEGEVFVLMHGDFGDSVTGVNGYGWHLAGEQHTFVYLGGGEKIGNSFENPVIER